MVRHLAKAGTLRPSTLPLELLELMRPLSTFCPPATIIDKTRYSAFAEFRLIDVCAGVQRTRGRT